MKKPPASLMATQEAGVEAGTHFSDTLPDFLSELLGYFGCLADQEGAWFAMGSSNFGVSFAPKPWHPGVHEHGWSRWALPGADGVTRSRLKDKSAPWVELSPKGMTFLHVGRKVSRLSLGELLDSSANHAYRVGAVMGWGGAE